MELYFLDKNYAVTDFFDGFSSVVWEEKFHDVGSFTVHFPADLLPRVNDAVFVRTSFADGKVKCGRIERISTGTGGDCVIDGRTLEVLLSDRVMTGNGVYTGTVTDAVLSAVEDNLRSCGVVIADEQPVIADEVSLSHDYDDLASWLYSTLKPYGASFSVTLDDGTNTPVFRIVVGHDRTTDTGDGDACVFSSSFGNIVSFEYERDTSEQKNVAYVKGKDGYVETVDESAPYSRREIHVRADDIRPTDFDTAEEYKAALRQRGHEILADRCDGMRVSVECDPDALPVYERDYFLGDLCDVTPENIGLSFPLRLTEADTVWENGKMTVFPIFGDEIRSIKKLLGDR